MGALWVHDGNPKRPHALLTSGKHSSGFFNSELVMEDSLLLDSACLELAERLSEQFGVSTIDRVVGPAMGAITIAHEMAYHIATMNMRTCLRAYTEKDPAIAAEGGVQMRFMRTRIKPGEYVLLVEDVITTGDSVLQTERAVTEVGGVIMPFVVTLVNRSGLTHIGEKKIVALVEREMPIWEAAACPLCAQGSEALRPKGAENWERLNATY